MISRSDFQSDILQILFRDSDIVKMLLQRSAWFRQDQLSACLDAAKALQAGLDAFVDRHDLVDQRFRGTDRDIIKGMQLLRRSLLEGSVRSQNRIGGKNQDNVSEDFFYFLCKQFSMALLETGREVILMEQ